MAGAFLLADLLALWCFLVFEVGFADELVEAFDLVLVAGAGVVCANVSEVPNAAAKANTRSLFMLPS